MITTDNAGCRPASQQRLFDARVASLAAAAAAMFALHLGARWAVWQRFIPYSALDIVTTFIFHWYAVAAAWGVWREGFSRRRAVGVTAWVSLGLTLWIVGGLHTREGFALQRGESVAVYNVVYWAVYFASAACWLMLARDLWHIRIVRASDGPNARRVWHWLPSITVRGLMLLTAGVAVASAFLRYSPAFFSIVFDGILHPSNAASLSIEPIAASLRGVALLTFAALVCAYAGRNFALLAVALVVAYGLAVLIEYSSNELKWAYYEYVLYQAVDSHGRTYIDVTPPLSEGRVDIVRGVASTLLTFISVLALPPLGYRIAVGRERPAGKIDDSVDAAASVGRASSLS